MFFKKNKPIIIGGFYRSGTTLLRRLLDSHSKIHCGPEVKFFTDFFNDYKNDELKHLRFFQTVRSLGINSNELLRIFGPAFIKSHEIAAKKAGKARWADKTPENILYAEEWQTLLKNKYLFIYVVRNPLDCLASLKETGFKKSLPEEFNKRVSLCREFLEKAIAYSKKHANKYYLVKYEDLAQNPETTLEKLLSFIGEPYEKAMLKNFNSKEKRKGIGDQKINLRNDIHADSISRWKNMLTKEESSFAVKELKSIAKQFDYLLTGEK